MKGYANIELDQSMEAIVRTRLMMLARKEGHPDPGRMFREAYPRMGLQPRMLSRTIEDGGTVTSCLCPWNSGGAFMAATLGVATVSYAPYAFLNLLVPLIAMIYAWSGKFILRQEVGEELPAADQLTAES